MTISSRFRLDNLRSLQLMQILRFGSILLGSILIAHNIGDRGLVGDFEFWVLLGSSTTFFWVSGIINTFIPYFHRQDPESQKVLVFNIFLLLSALALLVGVFIWIISSSSAKPLSSAAWFYLGYALLAAPAFFIEYLFLVHHKAKSIAIYAILSSLLYVAVFVSAFMPTWVDRSADVIIFYLDEGLINSIVMQLFLLGVLRYLYLIYLVGIFGKAKASFEILKPFLRQSWPMMVSLLFGGSMVYIDSYIVRIFFPPDQFALFQYGARELPLTLLLANAISNVVSGELAQQEQNAASLASLKTRSRRLMHQLFPLSIILLIFSRPLYALVFTESYLPSSAIFDIYLLLIISRVLFPQTILLSMGKTQTLLRATLLEWTVNLVLNLVFIFLLISIGRLDTYGLQAIALVTVIAYLFEKLYLASRLKHHSIPMPAYTPVKEWLIYSGIIVAVFIVKMVLF